MTYQLYIGSNNKTGQLEIQKIKQVLAVDYSGYTLTRGVGYWKGAEEQTAIVLLDTTPPKLVKTIYKLKKILNQDAIAYHKVEPLQFA